MKKPMFTKADEAEMDRLKLTKAERAGVADYNALRQEEKQAEKDKIAAEAHRDTEDMMKADALMKAYNTDPELWRKKNLLRVTASHMIPHTGSGCDLEVGATFAAYYDGKVRALSRPGDTELELGLVELLAVACLRCQWIEAQYPAGGNIAQGDYWNRNLEGAQRRVRKLSVDLARVRRLALPVLLLNIADKQQVNIGLVSKAPKGKG